MDIDSEGENDPRWLQTKTMMMIDDFTDVNEGEKELMKMWNLHIMKHGYVGDCQIPLACQMFLETKGKELLMKNLYRNFVLHMSSLFDFGLISPVILYQTIQKLQEMMKEGGEDGDVRKVLQKSHEAQVERWITTGMYATTDNVKTTSASAKTHFNSEISHSTARRKTTIPLGSPPNSQSIKSVHNTVSKHASMIGTPTSKTATTNITKLTGGFKTNQNTSSKTTSNNAVTVLSSSNVIKAIETTTVASNDISSNELPTRRKSTNSIVLSTNNTAPMRRKSMASENATNEYHRRKLVLDVIPSAANVNQKTSHNGESY